MTIHHPSGEEMSIYDAAMRYQAEEVPLVVIGGKEYGTGSSRDWAAKGTRLLGVKAVIVESFERIHRSNLVGMGVLPLQFLEGMDRKTLELQGTEMFDISGIEDGLSPRSISAAPSPMRTVRRRTSNCSAGSIRSTRSTTTATVASSSMCFATCWQTPPDRFFTVN